jgi:hypothetical protein
LGFSFPDKSTVLAADTLGDFMGFRYSTVTADTNWKACNGLVSQTTTDSGVAADTNIHLFEIVCDDSVPNIKFYIDGTLVATNTTNLPSADNLQVVIGEATQANVAKNIRVGLDLTSMTISKIMKCLISGKPMATIDDEAAGVSAQVRRDRPKTGQTLNWAGTIPVTIPFASSATQMISSIKTAVRNELLRLAGINVADQDTFVWNATLTN